MKHIRLYLSRTQVKRGGRLVLDIDDLDIPGGAFVGVIGVNGAGKSTFLKVCCGLLPPDRGMVRFGGSDLTALNPWRKTNLRKRLGYIPQAAEYNADLPFTLREVVAMGRAGVKPLATRLTREDDELIDLDAAITRLGMVDQRAAQLVKMRIFAGATVEEVARFFGTSPRTAKRTWAYARAWLGREVHK